MKTCRICGNDKKESEFYKRMATCKSCYKARKKLKEQMQLRKYLLIAREVLNDQNEQNR